VTDRKGKEKPVGDYALHVQCAWRITQGDTIITGRGDIFCTPVESEEPLPDDFDLDALLAGRHHMLGLRLWDAADRFGAREQFREAVRLSGRKRSRQLSRRYLLLMTYLTRRQTAEKVLAHALKLAGRT
jgi:hypothetical protein